MKRNISIIIGIFITIATYFFACEKITDISQNKNVDNYSNQLLDNNKAKPLNLVIVSAQLHRKIEYRPRDGEYCGCVNCFGICEVRFFPGIVDWFRDLIKNSIPSDPDGSVILMEFIDQEHAKLYILENRDFYENEFGVDSPIEIPTEALEGTNKNFVEISSDLYTFEKQEEVISYQGNDYTSCGYVIVNISCQ